MIKSLAEAKELLKNCNGYIGDAPDYGYITLDGDFTLEELEAIILVEREAT